MVELVQLEKSHEEFTKRQVQVVVISNDDQPTAQTTQADFPHLVVITDADQNMAHALQTIHPGASPTGGDTNAPTTFLVDGDGQVCWFRRPERFLARLSPGQVLAAIDETWGKSAH